jgi:hypothetical protein
LRDKYQELGYEMAKGTKGTGWLKFEDYQIPELIEQRENIIDWIYEKLTDTIHFDDEVGRYISEDLDRKIKELDIEYNPLDEYLDLRHAWVEGYSSYIIERIQELYPKMKEAEI